MTHNLSLAFFAVIWLETCDGRHFSRCASTRFFFFASAISAGTKKWACNIIWATLEGLSSTHKKIRLQHSAQNKSAFQAFTMLKICF
jgi:hypothetical protein